MRTITRRFAQGLLFIAPIAITGWIVWILVTSLDSLFSAPFPGFGFLAAVVSITLTGYLASNVVGRSIFEYFERALGRVPIVKLLYGSLRDLFGAFVGDRKRFDRPVVVQLNEHGWKAFGFITCDTFPDPQLQNHVAVYLPQSYNFAGNLIVVPKSRVTPIDADGASFMAFIMSGGVTTLDGASTIHDDHLRFARRH